MWYFNKVMNKAGYLGIYGLALASTSSSLYFSPFFTYMYKDSS